MASNPSLNSGVEYLREKFIDDTAQFPYYHMDFRMNKYIPRKQYDETLSGMDAMQQAFMRYGDWDFILDEGLLLNNKEFSRQTIENRLINFKDIIYGIIGVDMAGSGDDKTSFSYMAVTGNKKIIVMDNVMLPDQHYEEPLKQFIRRVPAIHKIVFESEGGSSSHTVKQYIIDLLRELQQEKHFYIEFKGVHTNKFERARPFAAGIRNGYIQIMKELPNYNTLLKQIMYVTPDKSKMREYESPDMLDSCTIAFNALDKGFYTQK